MPYLTRTVAAEHIGRSPRTIDKWIGDGMPSVAQERGGRLIRMIHTDDLKAWRQRAIERHETLSGRPSKAANA
ncbi:hypothetical protein ACIGKQ_03950 [Gordonia sp. NPDC062954]|uniref:hypothetical protein n=1 Tax=Gordonia sp. NPDC062954 TaxID=3364003 RepID=UPI0037CB71CB